MQPLKVTSPYVKIAEWTISIVKVSYLNASVEMITILILFIKLCTLEASSRIQSLSVSCRKRLR